MFFFLPYTQSFYNAFGDQGFFVNKAIRINSMSQSCCAHFVFRCVFDPAKFKLSFFFFCLFFLFSFL